MLGYCPKNKHSEVTIYTIDNNVDFQVENQIGPPRASEGVERYHPTSSWRPVGFTRKCLVKASMQEVTIREKSKSVSSHSRESDPMRS